MITLVLRPGKLGQKGQRYDVLMDGSVIVEGSLDPEHEAARLLLARGLTGSFQTVGEDGRVRMTFPDIEIAARYRVEENEKVGPRLTKYRPLSEAVTVGRLKLEGGHLGLPDPDEAS